MLGWIKHLQNQWAGWIGDKDLERALRSHLNGHGYYGDTAIFRNLRLVAVQRPGWVQVYSFLASARPKSTPIASESSDERAELYGLVRQDERYNRTEIAFFVKAHQRAAQFEEWSKDLVRLRRPSL